MVFMYAYYNSTYCYYLHQKWTLGDIGAFANRRSIARAQRAGAGEGREESRFARTDGTTDQK